jgi:nucleoside-diphosphate-sugar epimerase
MTDLRGKRILLTGATGFLGSRLARRLVSAEVRLVALVRPTSNLQELTRMGVLDRMDIRELTAPRHQDVFSEGKIDCLVHCAAHARGGTTPDDVRRFMEANVVFPGALFAAAAEAGVKSFVNTGTVWQSIGGHGYDPFDMYAASKESFQAIAEGIAVVSSASVVTLRLFDAYGEHDPRAKIISLMLRAYQSGETLAMSPGEQKLDLVHVEDVCTAFVRAISDVIRGNLVGRSTFCVTSGHLITLREVARQLEDISGRPAPIAWGRRAYRPREIMEPRASHPTLPGWTPQYDLAAGLRSLAREFGLCA